jgi:hypothetical protein
MHHLLLQAQRWWDAQRFDQPEWQLAARADQKVRHIQLHVAKALGKVVAVLDAGVGTASGIDSLARVRDEVLPDVAIYRSQLINTLLERGEATASPLLRTECAPSLPAAQPLWCVAMSLGRASARLAAYIEPREHGMTSPTAWILEAIQDLHDSAEALGTHFGVDLARAHQARLEELLGGPLPSSLLEPRREDP